MTSPVSLSIAYDRIMKRTERDTSTPLVRQVHCLVFTGATNSDGYGVVRVEGVLWLTHRLAFLLRNGHLPPAVRHRCDNPPCLEPRHHAGGTQADNLADGRAKGRVLDPPRKPGESNGMAVLTEADVQSIRALAGCVNDSQIAAEYGISRQHVRRIIRGEAWSHVLANPNQEDTWAS